MHFGTPKLSIRCARVSEVGCTCIRSCFDVYFLHWNINFHFLSDNQCCHTTTLQVILKHCKCFKIINLYPTSRKLRQKDASKFHIQLCLAMLFMLTVSFVLVVYSAKHLYILYEGCVVVSFLVHYFTLASVMLMGAEALIMFKKLVLIFSQVTTKFIVSVSIVCWSMFIINQVVYTVYQ